MIAEQAVDQHDVSRPCGIYTKHQPLADDANPRRGDEQFVAGAALHDLSIAGDDMNAGGFRGLRHRARDPAQRIDAHAFFDDHSTGQIQRRRTADGCRRPVPDERRETVRRLHRWRCAGTEDLRRAGIDRRRARRTPAGREQVRANERRHETPTGAMDVSHGGRAQRRRGATASGTVRLI